MKKLKAIIIIITLMFLFIVKINAECDIDELKKAANSVTIKVFEDKSVVTMEKDSDGNLVENTKDAEYAYVLAASPYNPDLEYVVIDSEYEETEMFKYSEKYQTQIKGSDIHYETKVYKIDIYSVGEGCNRVLLRTLTVEVPPFNELMLSDFCLSNPDERICQINYDNSDKTYEELEEEIAKIKESKASIPSKMLNSLKRYWYVVLLPLIIISIYYIIRINNYKRKVEEE